MVPVDLKFMCIMMCLPPSYAIGYYFDLIMKKKYLSYSNIDFEHACVMNLHACILNLYVCVLNRRAVWYGYNGAQGVDPTRMRVIFFQTAAGMCLQLRFI
jgi:hypothetical protein